MPPRCTDGIGRASVRSWKAAISELCPSRRAPITCQPLLGGSGVNAADTTLISHRGEDKLPLGHAFSRSWARAEGRRIDGEPAPKSGRPWESLTQQSVGYSLWDWAGFALSERTCFHLGPLMIGTQKDIDFALQEVEQFVFLGVHFPFVTHPRENTQVTTIELNG